MNSPSLAASTPVPNDDDLLPDDDDQAATAVPTRRESRRPPWKVLIVDDDHDMRAVSLLALHGLTVDDVAVDIIGIESAEAGRRYLRSHSDVAVAIVDVVMESETAGLDLIHWVRGELGDHAIRLVVRTGQPGNAPESQVIRHCDIHDYLGKSETTARRLASCVTGAIRAWRDVQTIQRQRQGVQKVLGAINALFHVAELDTLLQTIVTEVVALLGPAARGALLVGPEALSRDAEGPWRVVAATGECASLTGQMATSLRSDNGVALNLDTLPPGVAVRRGDALLYAFAVDDGFQPVLVCLVDDVEPWAQDLTELYTHAVTLALRNRLLWEKTVGDISRVLAEREVLLQEIHHRVKNNLQIVSSLLSMQAGKAISNEARAVIIDSELRVRSISLVHQLLYGSHDYLHVNLGLAARNLTDIITASLGSNAVVMLETQSAEVSVDQAIPCCLILNELITNSIKHGRSADGSCTIHVKTRQTGSKIEFSVADEGPGLPEHFRAVRGSSLGIRIIESLVHQLRGTFTVEPGPGARLCVSFTVEDKASLPLPKRPES